MEARALADKLGLKDVAFQKLANDPTLGAINNITTTGVGFFFRTQFDRIRFRRKGVDVSQR